MTSAAQARPNGHSWVPDTKKFAARLALTRHAMGWNAKEAALTCGFAQGVPIEGGYEFRALTKQVDATALLAMEREEMVDTVVASYFDSSRRRGPSLIRFTNHNYSYLVAKNAEDEGFYLVWGGADENTDLTEDVYEACVHEGEKEGLKPVYHIYSRFNLFTTAGVHWYQIPDRILTDFGLDVRTESYTAEEV